MGSGINTTFRQVGIATGVAALGSILATEAGNSVVGHLGNGPLAGRAHELAASVSGGSVIQAMHGVPASLRGLAFDAARLGYIDGLNKILLIGAVVALAAAALTFVLIRQRDFVGYPTGAEADTAGAPSPSARTSVAAG
jgi:hypothetical protein